MTELQTVNPPSPFIVRWVKRLRLDFATPGLALDIAAGQGRHTRALAEAGFHAVGVDRNFPALDEGRRLNAGGPRHSLVCADLTTMVLVPDRFQVVVVSRYLDRGLFNALRACLVPGGSLVYETFTTRQLALGRGPRSLVHLLNPGELRFLVSAPPSTTATTGLLGVTGLSTPGLADEEATSHRTEAMDILFDEEVTWPNAVARLVARKR